MTMASPAGLLDGRTDHAAGVGVNNLMIGGIGGKEAMVVARQGDTGGGQRTDGEHDLVLWESGSVPAALRRT